jgi:hypothetical protein
LDYLLMGSSSSVSHTQESEMNGNEGETGGGEADETVGADGGDRGVVSDGDNNGQSAEGSTSTKENSGGGNTNK